MRSKWKTWLLGDPFRPDLEAAKLPVWEGPAGPGGDLVTEFSALARSLWRRLELVEAASGRGRAGAPGAIGRPDEGRDVMELARSMLPSLDALDRIVEMGEEFTRQDEGFANWLCCIEALRRRMLKTLEGIGLTPISSIGSEVDLDVHDVVSVVQAGAEFPPNTVVEERLRGYYFKGKLIRDAKVVVAQ